MYRLRSVVVVFTGSALLAAAALLGSSRNSATGDSEPSRAEAASFEEVFTAYERLRLGGTSEEPIGSITGLSFDTEGRIAVVDRQSDRVFVFHPDGRLRGILGRSGSGPGEFEDPVDVEFDDEGRLFVAETGAPRITSYDASLALDTVFRVEEAYYAMQLSSIGENILAYVNAPDDRASRLRVLGKDGTERKRFHVSHPAYVQTPYWSAATSRVLATSDRWIIAGGNLIYPLSKYTSAGEFVDSVGYAPERWRQASRPRPGAFRGPNRWRQFEKWRRTFTTIQNLAIVRDKYLVISHQRLDPDIHAYEDAEYFADVYDLKRESKLWTGIDLPGPILAGGKFLTLLVQRPPEGWVLGRYGVGG